MIIFNITTNVDWQVHEQWLAWMKQSHIPEILATGCFQKYQMVRLIEVDETEGPTYAIQCYAESKEKYQKYSENDAMRMNNIVFKKWGNRVVTFQTVMEVIH